MVSPYRPRDPDATTGTEYCSRCGGPLGGYGVWLQSLDGSRSQGPMHPSCSAVTPPAGEREGEG